MFSLVYLSEMREARRTILWKNLRSEAQESVSTDYIFASLLKNALAIFLHNFKKQNSKT